MALDQELLQLAQSNPVGVQSALASRRPQFAQFKGSGQSRVTAPQAPLSAPSLPSAPAGRQGLLSQVLNQMVGNLFSGQVNPEAIAAGLDSSERQGGMEVPPQALPASDMSPQDNSQVPPPQTTQEMPPEVSAAESATASPQTVYSYARSKGASHEHAMALVTNAKGESSFNPNAVGDNGNSFGLFQWNGKRREKLFDHYGGKAPTWRQQLDYILSGAEPESKEFLNKRFESSQGASKWFTYNWERPLYADKDASVRASWAPQLESQIDPRMASTGGEGENAGMAIPSGDPMTGRATLPPTMEARPPGFDESQGILSSIYQDLQKGPDAPSRREQALTSPFFAKLGQFGAMTGLAPLTMPLAIGGAMARQREARYLNKVRLGMEVVGKYTDAQNSVTNYQHAARAGRAQELEGRITPEVQARGVKPQMFRDRATGETHAAYFDATDQRWHNADNGQAIQIPSTWETMGASGSRGAGAEPNYTYVEKPGEPGQGQWWDKSSGEPPPEGFVLPSSARQAAKTPSASKDAEQVGTALETLDALEEVAFGNKDNPGAFGDWRGGGIGGLLSRVRQAGSNVVDMLTQDEQSQVLLYERSRQALLALFARAQGEKGTLSDKDIQRAAESLPAADVWPDSPEQARKQFEFLRKLLTDRYNPPSEEEPRKTAPPTTEGQEMPPNKPTNGSRSMEEIQADIDKARERLRAARAKRQESSGAIAP